jgi:hypothetical protein
MITAETRPLNVHRVNFLDSASMKQTYDLEHFTNKVNCHKNKSISRNKILLLESAQDIREVSQTQKYVQS